MPSKSPKQAKMMRALAHGWKPTGLGAEDMPSVAVAKEFTEADKKKAHMRAAVLRRKE